MLYPKAPVFMQILRSLRFGDFAPSSLLEEPTEIISVMADQCSGAPFMLPTAGSVEVLFHQYNGYACYSCNPGCDHTGIDIYGGLGTAVYVSYSSAPGQVLLWSGSCAIRIWHQLDGSWGSIVPSTSVSTYYSHLRWRRGEGAVQAGEKIGEQGDCGTTSGNVHLHYSIGSPDERCIANVFDPSPYLGAKSTRTPKPAAYGAACPVLWW